MTRSVNQRWPDHRAPAGYVVDTHESPQGQQVASLSNNEIRDVLEDLDDYYEPPGAAPAPRTATA